MTVLVGFDLSTRHSPLAWAATVLCVAATVPAGLRWLRVAQREHYLAGSASRFAVRWWTAERSSVILLVAAAVAAVESVFWPVAGVVVALVVAAGPVGLAVRGRTSPLAWTRRLRTLAGVWVVLQLLVLGIGLLTGLALYLAMLGAVAVPVLVDAACAVTAPVERRLAGTFVARAGERLRRVDPVVVGITGSFGKTSTKNHLVHLVQGSRTVVATPASFNNRAGLARAVNEQLADGTEVFVAEMGTYGPGEIADLCRWCPPNVAVITAIGPVHLERFKSEGRILEAKSEITVGAEHVVLPVDDARLAALADQLEASGRSVVRVSGTGAGDDDRPEPRVVVTGDGTALVVSVDGAEIARVAAAPPGVHPRNLACAVGVAVVLGIPPEAVGARVATLGGVEHRLHAVASDGGFAILDDTYNSNPSGAAEALRTLVATGSGPGTDPGPWAVDGAVPGEGPGTEPDPATGTSTETVRRVVVTPGMVELGERQGSENRTFAAAAAAVASDLVVVGRTNRRALVDGARSGRAAVTLVADRQAAVDWVRRHLGPGDVVLYENDLPDHYP